jgi:hypothetical protein
MVDDGVFQNAGADHARQRDQSEHHLMAKVVILPGDVGPKLAGRLRAARLSLT